MANGDVDGDGSPDLVSANLYAQTLSVLLNRGDGTFRARHDYRAGGDVRSVAIGDLNLDGKPDLVAANQDSSALSVLLNRGDGTFRAPRKYQVPAPVAVAVGDLSGDGRPDVVAVNRTSTVSVLLGRGDGSLRGAHDYPTGLEPVSVGLGDLNGDGRPDLMTANAEANTVSVLFNKGNGSFQPRRDHAVGRGPMAVATGDLSGDGKPDIAAANLDSNTVSVLLNRGDGSFQTRNDYRGGSDPRSVVIADVDGDAAPDVVTGNAEASLASVLINEGAGSFQARRDYATGRHAVSLVVSDLNGNGRQDLATANLDADSVSILLGTTTVLCTTPDVLGNTLTSATQAIEDAHCRVGTIRRTFSDSVEKDRVSSEQPRVGTTLSAGSGIDLVISDGPRPGGRARGLLLWNRLGSAQQVRHSVFGPNLAYFACRDRTTPAFGGHCSTDVRGKLRYVRGAFGRAATIGGGPYFPGARVHTAILRKSILNPEHGAVEVWYRQRSNPVPGKHNPHRIFGGPYSLAGADEVMLFSQDRRDSGHPRLHFEVFFGEEPPPSTLAHVVAVRSLVDGGRGYQISQLNGRWIHVAGVWDRRGISGSKDTVRLYVNGKVVAESRATNWGTTPCGRRVSARPAGACFTDVAGCNDTCAGAFAVGDLKLWNYAKTR